MKLNTTRFPIDHLKVNHTPDNNTLHTEPRAARLFLLACLSPRPGERCRYPAKTMPRISLKSIFILVAIAALLLVPVRFLAHHLATWGPAERTEGMIGELFLDALGNGDAPVTIHDIDALLDTPKFQFLKQHRIQNAKLAANELAWFSPNSKYTIVLGRDGSKLWIIDGERAGF